jgi:hypothetical protein
METAFFREHYRIAFRSIVSFISDENLLPQIVTVAVNVKATTQMKRKIR